jgi:purine-binding chemotaxis protein CheW
MSGESRARSGPQKTLVGFELGEVHYAVDISRVMQIVKPLPMTVLPRMPEGLVGVCEYRGVVTAVVDLRMHFGLEPQAPTRQTKWLVLDVGGRPVVLVVDGVTDVFGAPGEQLRSPPSFGAERQGIVGVASHGSRMTFVIDAGRFHALAQLPPSLSVPPRLGGVTAHVGPGSRS